MISSISDIHIKKSGDDRSKLLLNFLKHEKVVNSKYIFLLGDIFDLMIGNHHEYLFEFSEIFEEIVKLCNRGKRVYYFEGNHDFLLSEFFNYFSSKNQLGSNFFYSPTDIQLTINGREFYCCHGDNIEIDNPKYKIYKKLINNNFTHYLSNNIVPYQVIQMIGHYASARSRKKNQQKYNLMSEKDLEYIKKKFRDSADIVKTLAPEVDFIISGHSHVEDIYRSKNGYIYLNNGHLPNTKKFIYLDEKLKPSFVKLSPSP